jgi:FKBP-type peptidyl-prolyl cis-trans isomerase (trigger factor)
MVEDVRHRTRDQKLPKGFDEKKFRENNREYAVWQGKWILLKERIAAAENITVHEGELEALAAEEAAKTGIAKERLLQYYKESAGTEDRIRTDKLMAFLRSSAKVTEKSDTQQ